MSRKSDKQDEIFAGVKVAFEKKYEGSGIRLKKDLKNLLKMREQQIQERAIDAVLDACDLDALQITAIKEIKTC